VNSEILPLPSYLYLHCNWWSVPCYPFRSTFAWIRGGVVPMLPFEDTGIFIFSATSKRSISVSLFEFRFINVSTSTNDFISIQNCWKTLPHSFTLLQSVDNVFYDNYWFQPVVTPWLQFAKSPAVWAIVAAHTCCNWGTYTLLTNIPTYMKEVLKFDIQSVTMNYHCLFN